jgi:endonuclease/exonuclease/phosphatase family metal-dependent hydrolase
MFSAVAVRSVLVLATLALFIPQAGKKPSKATQPPPASTDQSLLEVGQAKRLKQPNVAPTQIKVISYNIRWRGGDDLREMIKLFRDDTHIGGASILCLQEVDRQKKRTDNVNTVKLIADELGMYYAWSAPPTVDSTAEEETGVAILSAYPLADLRRIVLPNGGPGGRRRVALGATVAIAGTRIRFYSVHAETRIAVDRKLEQFRAVLDDLARYPLTMPALIAGDFNTWESSAVTKTRKLFTESNFQTPFDDRSTFSRKVLFFPVELKLDWIWLRGLHYVDNGIDQKIKLSDHWPLWCIVKMPSEK